MAFQHREIIAITRINRIKAVLTHITNYRDNGVRENQFYVLDYGTRWDYPIYYKHSDKVGWDRPEALPGKVRTWVENKLRKLLK